MDRRTFIHTVAGGVLAGPGVGRAQQPVAPVIGFLRSASLADATPLLNAFREGLKEAGFVEGQNVAIEYRFADNHPDRLPALASDLIRRPVAVIVGNTISAHAAKTATTTVPVVFATGSDPVRDGLVARLNRPGGNVTGVVFYSGVLGAKRLELLHQLVPKARAIGVLVNSDNAEAAAERRDIQAAAEAVRQQLFLVDVGSASEIETAFASFSQRGAVALLVGSGAFLNSQRERIVLMAARLALPACYSLREPVMAGGLMSYGASITEAYRQTGVYAGRILKGEKPADLPVIQSTKVELVINLKTAKTLGLTIPQSVLLRADEVIQ